MILIITVGAPSTLLVVSWMSRHAFICLDILDLSVHHLLAWR